MNTTPVWRKSMDGYFTHVDGHEIRLRRVRVAVKNAFVLCYWIYIDHSLTKHHGFTLAAAKKAALNALKTGDLR